MNRSFFIISYDLKVPGKDYSALFDAIKNLSGEGYWQHPLESTWVVYTTLDVNDIYEKLHSVMDNNDLLLVLAVDPTKRQGWLAKSFWEWMRSLVQQ